MRLYIFQETEPVRFAEKDEWIRDDEGDFIQIGCSGVFEKNILVKSEIEIPDNTDIIRIGVKEIGGTDSYHFGTIPIVHSKKKVKKWQWLYWVSGNNGYELTKNSFPTKEEALAALSEFVPSYLILKIKKLEIEE